MVQIAIRPKAVTVDRAKRKLRMTWSDGKTTQFHFVWLRHNARCYGGMPNDTSVKIDLLPDDPASLEILSFDVNDKNLQIQWKDSALNTKHDFKTLRRIAYDAESRIDKKQTVRYWHTESFSKIPKFEHASLDDPKTLLQAQLGVRDYGIVRIQNVPITPGSIASVAEHFGPIHVNNYGRVFDVRTKTNVSLGSNTGAYLGPHTDESYRHAPPGITLFHCLIASTAGGGETILVDGFNAAEIFKKKHTESFEILSQVPVFFQRMAPPEEDMRAHGKIIATDIDGNIEGIRFTDRTLPPQDLPDKLVEPVYKAIKQFWNIINSDDLKVIFPMKPGDLNIFDNHRVLHGRTAFDTGKTNRHLQQCSVNRDEFHNSLRILAAKLDDDRWDSSMTGGALG